MKLSQKIKGLNPFKKKSIADFSIAGGLPIILNNYSGIDYRKLSPSQVTAYLQGIVSACIDKRANSSAQAIPVIYKDVAGMDTRKNKAIEDHPFTNLLNAPNPYTSRFELMFQTVSNLDAWGNSYWLISKNGLGLPVEIKIINPNEMHYLFDENNTPVGFKRTFYTGTGMTLTRRQVEYDLDEIIHFKYAHYNANSLYGLSIIQKASQQIEIHSIENHYQKNLLKNGGRPSIIFETQDTLKPNVKDAIKEQFKDSHSGGHNAGKAMVLDGGLKANTLAFNPAEIGFLESKKASRDEILAMFNVPIGMFFVENVNKANNESGINNFLKNTISDIIKQIDSKLTIYVKQNYNKKFYVEHKLPYEHTRAEQFKEILEGTKLGAISLNEFRDFTDYDADNELTGDKKWYAVKFNTTTSNNNDTANTDNNA